jgi:crossover junction endodeoxyribonuclease RuvC
MQILAIDPGTATTGYGLINAENSSLEAVDFGIVSTDSKQETCSRLETIFDSIHGLLKNHKPDCLVAEQLFFNTNSKTAISVGQARGVIMLAAAKGRVNFFEYTPLQVKQSVCGYGRADKQQVAKMVKLILKMDELPTPDDAADALALAICHANNCRTFVGQLS